MDTLAFWLPLALLFFSALAGTALKRRARDHCLKKFEESKVVLPNGQDQWEKGVLRVFAQGIELAYENKRPEDLGVIESLVLHPSEVDGIAYLLAPGTGSRYACRSGMGKRAATHSLPLVPEQGHSGGPELLQYAAGCIRAGLAGDSWRDQQGLFDGRG